MSIYSDNMRLLFANAHKKRNEGLTEPEDIVIYRDIVYGNKGTHPEWQKLDVYTPSEGTGKWPLIINVHGGAWVEGDKEEYKYFCMDIVKYGFAVVNFSYRLAPEYPFPAAIEDIDSVMGWICEHHEEYDIDTDRIYAIGDSSGGHALALYAALLTGTENGTVKTSPHDKNLLKAIGINSSNVFFGNFDKMTTAQKHTMEDLFGDVPSDTLLRDVDIENLITSDYPPVYMITGNKDVITKDMTEFASLLDKKGVDCVCRIYGSEDNPLGHVFFLNIRSDESQSAIRDEIFFFNSL